MLFGRVIGYSMYFLGDCTDVSRAGINEEDQFEFKLTNTVSIPSIPSIPSISKHIAMDGGSIVRYPERLVFQVDIRNGTMFVYPIETSTYTTIAPPTQVSIVEEYYKEFDYSIFTLENRSFKVQQEYEGFEYSLNCTNYNLPNPVYTDMIDDFESKATAELYLFMSIPNSFVFVGDTPYLFMEITGAGRRDVGYMNINYVELYKRQERAFLKIVMHSGYTCEFRGVFEGKSWYRDTDYAKDPTDCPMQP